MATKTKPEEEIIEHTDPKDDLVEVYIPRDPRESEDDSVTLNGYTYGFQRGHRVKVPRAVYEILRERERMVEKSYAYIEKVQADAADASKHQ